MEPQYASQPLSMHLLDPQQFPMTWPPEPLPEYPTIKTVVLKPFFYRRTLKDSEEEWVVYSPRPDWRFQDWELEQMAAMCKSRGLRFSPFPQL